MKRSLYRQVGKRVLDVVLVAAASPLLLPLFVLLAAAVKLTSRGPVFYRQVRAGRHGDLFDLLKFRSMVVGAERMGAGVRVEPNDARITAVGRLLRRFSLDEIPQIVNVVRGQMSLIGPRPALPYQVAQYTSAQRRRLEVRPGLTGWAQVNGRNVINWQQRIVFDVAYVDRLTLWMDLRIMLKTIPTVLVGGGTIARTEYWERPQGGRSKADGSSGKPPGQS